MKRVIPFVSATTASVLVAYLSASHGLAYPAQGATGTARIVVKVELSGTAPAPEKIQASADPYCAVAHQTDALLSQAVQVGADGALINALVFVKDGVSGTYPAPHTPVTLDQKGCVFLPHVIGMMTGQPLQIVNSSAYIATFAHPFFGVSNRQGIVELSNLPAGTFQINAWHEKYGVQVQSASVAAGEVKPITFSFKGNA